MLTNVELMIGKQPLVVQSYMFLCFHKTSHGCYFFKQEHHIRNEVEVIFVANLFLHEKSQRMLEMDQVLDVAHRRVN